MKISTNLLLLFTLFSPYHALVQSDGSTRDSAAKLVNPGSPPVYAPAINRRPRAPPKSPVTPPKTPAAPPKAPATAPKAPTAAPKVPAVVPVAPAAAPKVPATAPKVPAAAAPKVPTTASKVPTTPPVASAAAPQVSATDTKTPATVTKAPVTGNEVPAPGGTVPPPDGKVPATVGKDSAASCAVQSAPKKVRSAKFVALSERAIARSQFHATCLTNAQTIETQIRAGTFDLQPTRRWDDEFSWSGGFYVTPDRKNAAVYGAIWLAGRCADQGGVVVLELSFSTTGLQVKEVPGDGSAFRNEQHLVGAAFKTVLGTPPGRPPVISLQQADQARDDLTARNPMPDELKPAYNAIRDIDVVSASAPFTRQQQEDIDDRAEGIPPFEGPFKQVVLRTPAALGNLNFVARHPLDECLRATSGQQILKKLKALCSGMCT